MLKRTLRITSQNDVPTRSTVSPIGASERMTISAQKRDHSIASPTSNTPHAALIDQWQRLQSVEAVQERPTRATTDRNPTSSTNGHGSHKWTLLKTLLIRSNGLKGVSATTFKRHQFQMTLILYRFSKFIHRLYENSHFVPSIWNRYLDDTWPPPPLMTLNTPRLHSPHPPPSLCEAE